MNDDGPLVKCDREPNFPKLFEVLGDAEAQAKIRQDYPDTKPCFLLRDHPSACASLPFDISGPLGDFKKGALCPNNPFVKFGEKIARQEAYSQLVSRAGELYRASRVGALGIDSPSVEITMAYTFGDWIEARRSEAKQWQGMSSDSSSK